jgi:hypothetical protein
MLTDSTRFPVNASDHNGVLPRYSSLLLPDRPLMTLKFLIDC